MVDPESPAARRHRFARTLRSLPTVDAAAQLLEAFERETIQRAKDGRELSARVSVQAPSPAAIADALNDVDIPWELAEVESLPDWTYETLLDFAIKRLPAPSYQFEGEPYPRVMRAHDLLAGRKYELIGVLAMATEQAWNLGDNKAVKAMSQLCQTAVLRVVGMAALRVALHADEGVGDAE